MDREQPLVSERVRVTAGFVRYVELLTENLPYAEDVSLDETDVLTDLGLDSLGTVRLLAVLEEEFDVELPDEALQESTFQTVGTLWQAFANCMDGDAS
jgi:acyl carrier protein